MRKLREILRLKLHVGLSGRAIARSCNLSPSTASDYLRRIAAAKLSWPLPPELDDDAALERVLYPDEGHPVAHRPEPDWAQVHRELRRKHVTKQLLWQEYRELHPDGYQYSRFCEQYGRWVSRLGVTMRQEHRAGEKGFVDFSGDGIEIVDPVTGEITVAKLFVMVLGASNLTYVEPALSEDLPTWVACHVRAYEFLGGVPAVTVPDNLKSGVKRADNYEPELNPTYADLAAHYGTAVIPARKRRPRDKAKVEQAVLLAERWIIAVLRNRTFFSLDEVREAVKPLVARLNDRVMRRIGKSRRQLFEELERAALRPLPATPYELALWSRPRVGPNYHVEYEDHFYSVPWGLLGERLDLRATSTTIEILHRNRRITTHARSFEKGKYSTRNEHMPRGHREYAEWTPLRLVTWAKNVGPATASLVEEIMRRRPHPEHGFRPCLGILRLRKHYEDARLEKACARAVRTRAYSYKSVVAILRHNLDRDEAVVEERQAALPLHENVRGPAYYA